MLHPHHKELYQFIAKHIEKTGYAPTYREMVNGLKSSSCANPDILSNPSVFSVHRWTSNLVEGGYLTREDHEHRGLKLTRKKLP